MLFCQMRGWENASIIHHANKDHQFIIVQETKRGEFYITSEKDFEEKLMNKWQH